MVNYTYSKENWPDYHTGSNIEWCITNSTGAYASATLIDSMASSSHGYLISPIIDHHTKYVILEQVNEKIGLLGHFYDLESANHIVNNQSKLSKGYEQLVQVTYDGVVQFQYELGNMTQVSESAEDTDIPAFAYAKTIALERDSNTVVISYDVRNNSDSVATLGLTPLFNFRPLDKVTDLELPKFDEQRTGNTLSLVPRTNPHVRIDFAISEGTYIQKISKIDFNSQYDTDAKYGRKSICSHFTPYEIDIQIAPKSTHSISVICRMVYSPIIEGSALLQKAGDLFIASGTARGIISSVKNYYKKLDAYTNIDDYTAKQLVHSADHFLVDYLSGETGIMTGYPTNREYERDAMIAFTGLTLSTKRYSEAKNLLLAFSSRVQDGLFPNVLCKNNSTTDYSIVDTSLWYIIDVYNYLDYLSRDVNISDDRLNGTVAFIHNKLLDSMIRIIDTFENSISKTVFMLSNGLLHVGNASVSGTWMNSKYHGRAITPRIGCSVEINALWYNALRVMEYFFNICGYDGSHYSQLADTVKISFINTFWNKTRNCLYDVVKFNSVSEELISIDDSIRPNQIYAISLPFNLLPIRESQYVLNIIEKYLLTDYGLRSLSTGHPDYSSDYLANDTCRSLCVHNGMVHSYLLGAYITAYRKLHGPSTDVTDKLIKIITPTINHLSDSGCVGGINELFLGEAPYTPCGDMMHAASIAEILRAYFESILPTA